MTDLINAFRSHSASLDPNETPDVMIYSPDGTRWNILVEYNLKYDSISAAIPGVFSSYLGYGSHVEGEIPAGLIEGATFRISVSSRLNGTTYTHSGQFQATPQGSAVYWSN